MRDPAVVRLLFRLLTVLLFQRFFRGAVPILNVLLQDILLDSPLAASADLYGAQLSRGHQSPRLNPRNAQNFSDVGECNESLLCHVRQLSLRTLQVLPAASTIASAADSLAALPATPSATCEDSRECVP